MVNIKKRISLVVKFKDVQQYKIKVMKSKLELRTKLSSEDTIFRHLGRQVAVRGCALLSYQLASALQYETLIKPIVVLTSS